MGDLGQTLVAAVVFLIEEDQDAYETLMSLLFEEDKERLLRMAVNAIKDMLLTSEPKESVLEKLQKMGLGWAVEEEAA